MSARPVARVGVALVPLPVGVQTRLVSDQPETGRVSVTLYAPGVRAVNVLGLRSVGSASSSRLKSDRPKPDVVYAKSRALLGSASLMIVIEPRLGLVYVQRTFSRM